VTDGSAFTLTCSTASAAPAGTSLTYEWTKDSAIQVGQTSSTLQGTADITNVSSYTCKVSANTGANYSHTSPTFQPTGKHLL
jgi:hypothetical protein